MGDVRIGDVRMGDVGGWADVTTSMESNAVVGCEAGSEVVAESMSVYLRGHAFALLVWPNA
jgi:hypothetical protein